VESGVVVTLADKPAGFIVKRFVFDQPASTPSIAPGAKDAVESVVANQVTPLPALGNSVGRR